MDSEVEDATPYAVIFDYPGWTLAQYDQVLAEMGLDDGPEAPEEALFHWVAATEDGVRIVDVYRSELAWKAFYEQAIATARGHIDSPEPIVTSYSVHKYFISSTV